MQITHSYDDILAWFFSTLKDLLQNQKTVTVGLAGGTSFDEFYKKIIYHSSSLHFLHSTLFNRIHWCLTDERVNCDEKDRNDAHIWDVFLGPLSEIGFSKEEYFIRLPHHLPVTSYQLPLTIDIAFFGIGPDGHTASLFPHHEALNSREIGYIQIRNAPKPPPDRISLSPKSIQSLKNVCLFVVGVNKKEALANFLNKSVSMTDCPVKLLKPEIVFDGTGEKVCKNKQYEKRDISTKEFTDL